jgi:flagellar motor switch protein FliG
MKTAEIALTGTQKVAVVLMQIGRDAAALVLQKFSEAEAEEIVAEIVRMQRVDTDVAEQVMNDFHGMITTGRPAARGGHDFAAGLLEATFGAEKATGLMDRLASSMAGKSFEFLDTADTGQISALMEGELPETIALIMAHLKPQQAAAVLAGLSERLRIDVAQSIATMGSANPDAISIVADILKVRAGAVVSSKEKVEVRGGVHPLVEIINRADVTTERHILDGLDALDPALAEEIRAQMLTFSDIVKLERRDVQVVLRGIDSAVLALAMKGAPTAVVEVIETNVSERNLEILQAEISSLGPVRASQVEEAKAEIVRSIREMEAAGTITVRRTEDDDIVL